MRVVAASSRTAVVVNIAAAAVPALARGVGLVGDPARGVVAETGVGEVVMLGVLNLIWVLPAFVVAASVGAAAARRGRAFGLVLGAVLIASLPVVMVAPLLTVDGPDIALYLIVLYGAGFVRLRQVAARTRDG